MQWRTMQLPWKCNKYTWIGHWTVNMEDGQATQKQCKSNDASSGSNGAVLCCVLAPMQWSCGSDDVERKRGIAPELEIGQRDGWMRTCGVRNKYWKYKYKYKHKYKH